MVRGLTTYVYETPGILQDHRLRETRVVIDGKGLAHILFFEMGVDFQHGGDYRAFEVMCTKFFRALLHCGVKPYVLYDGADDLEDEKFETLVARAQRKVDNSVKISKGQSEGRRVRPAFATDVFIKVVRDLDIPFVACDFEADVDIAALANRWGCPVVSEDSDFFIFDITGGYIPIHHLLWQEVNVDEGGAGPNEVKCKIFKAQDFCRRFRMEREMLPLLATLLGNDYIEGRAFDELYHSRIKREVRIAGRPGVRVPRIITWVGRQRSFDGMYRTMASTLSGTGTTVDQMERSIEIYKVPGESKFQAYFEDGGALPEIPVWSLPRWCVEFYRQGLLPPTFMNIKYQSKNFLVAFVEDSTKKSCNQASKRIRQVIYGILLQRAGGSLEGEKLAAEDGQNKVIEIDREGDKARSRQTPTLASLPGFGELPDIERVTGLGEEDRRRLIMEVLDVDQGRLQDLPEDLKLPVATTIYWMAHADPAATRHLMRVLLLGIAIGQFRDEENTEGSTANLDDLPPKLDLTAVQAFAQWHSCIDYATQLNALINRPYPVPDATKLYHGTLLHRINATTKRGQDVDPGWVHREVLSDCPRAFNLFKQLNAVMETQ